MTTQNEATREGASTSDTSEGVDFHELFLAQRQDAQTGPSEPDEEDNLETPSESKDAEDEAAQDGPSESDADDEGEENGEQNEPSEEQPAQQEASLDALVPVKVDGEETKVPVRDLVRLAGQEKVLTRRSEEAAEAKRKADETFEVASQSLEKSYKDALEDYEQYREMDFLVLAQEVTPEVLAQLRKDEAKARERLEYFHQELGQFGARRTERAQAQHYNEAVQCIKVLSDPSTGIQGWNEQMYNTYVNYMVDELGVPKMAAGRLTDPVSFKIIDRLYRLERGQKAMETKTSKPKPVPTTVMKSVAEPAGKPAPKAARDAALAKAKETGDSTDISNAFLALTRK